MNWDAAAKVWLLAIKSAKDKSLEFNRLGSVWSPFKPNFINKFGDKCWYSEVPRMNTDFNVDHFRPKGAVKKTKGIYATKMLARGKNKKHPGYWWLAFEPKNYRYSCQYANQPRDGGGKHDYFPLTDESTRVWRSCSLKAHTKEQVQLLDPCVATDIELLSFDKSPGLVHSRYDKRTDPDKYERVKDSAKYYNLNHKTVKDERLKVIEAVQSDLQLLELTWGLPIVARQTMQSVVNTAEHRLIKACDRKSPFSAAAVAFVKPKRAEDWLANVLPHLDLNP
ncbi:hypothetical protein ACVBKF_00715 [Shewanella sp. 0m-11]